MLTDFTMAWLAHEVVGTRAEQSRVFILDGHAASPFDAVWRDVYSMNVSQPLLRKADFSGTVTSFRRILCVLNAAADY